MDYEKKYYIALDKARLLHHNLVKYGVKIITKDIEDIFPELKESENKRMIQYFKDLAPFDKADELYEKYGFSHKDAIAWLEKQAEQKPTLPKWKYKKDHTPLLRDSLILNKYGCVAKSSSGAIVSDVWVIDYDELAKLPKEESEKQGEQKPTKNIVETWKEMRLEVYQQASGNRHEPNYSDDTTKMFSLNDVDEIIEKMSEQKPAEEYSFNIESELFHQLTQAQQGLWRKEIEQAYNAGADTQKPAWSEEDELHIRELESLVKRVWATAECENDKDTIHKMSDLSFFLKTLKPQLKQEWSEEDEKMYNVVHDLAWESYKTSRRLDIPTFGIINDWLKSIKDRVQPQPKQEWSEEDERMLRDTIAYIEAGIKFDGTPQLDWLKSLRPQKQQHDDEWSDEDKEFLKWTLRNLAELKDRYGEDYGKVGKCIDWLNSLQPQPIDVEAAIAYQEGYQKAVVEFSQKQQEWTDEDINMIDWLIRCCEKEHEELCNDRYGHQEIVSDLKRDCRKKWDWLESLKGKVAPQKHWKPTEEQIKAVKEAACYSSVFSEKTIDNLISLSKQLKKLREA